MAVTQATLTAEPRAISIGPLKQQLLLFSAASGATGGTLTADSLSTVKAVVVGGIVMSAQPTFSGNVITLAFVDPAATVHAQCIAYGV